MTKKITFVSPSVKEFVTNTAMSGGDKTKIDTKEEYSELKNLLANNKNLPENERDYVRGFLKEYENNVVKAVVLESNVSTLSESKALTTKQVRKELLNNAKYVLEQEEGIKISKGKIRKYSGDSTLNADKKSISKMFGYEKEFSAEAKNNAKEEKINVIKAVIKEARTFIALESKSLAAKDVKREMLEYVQTILEQEKGIKVSKREIEKYAYDKEILMANRVTFINNNQADVQAGVK